MTKNCVILGPSDIQKICKFGKIVDIDKYINEAAQFLSKNFQEILIVPDYGLTLLIVKRYKILKKEGIITGYIPDKTSSGKDISEFYQYCDNIKGIGGGWHNLNTELTRQTDYVFCFGYSAGVFIELCSIKYNQQYYNLKTKIFIDLRCVSSKLPKEVESDLLFLEYFDDFNMVEKKINQQKNEREIV